MDEKHPDRRDRRDRPGDQGDQGDWGDLGDLGDLSNVPQHCQGPESHTFLLTSRLDIDMAKNRHITTSFDMGPKRGRHMPTQGHGRLSYQEHTTEISARKVSTR